MKLNYFNFKPFRDKILMTNDLGDFIFVNNEEFKKIISKNVDPNSSLWERLIASNMIYDNTDLEYTSSARYMMRKSKNYVNIATELHIFAVTTACNMNCVYCQANNGISHFDLIMNKDIAERAVNIALQSPSKQLEFEFQGGEPLTNFEVVKHIVEYAEQYKGNHEIYYSIVSNLTLLTDEMLEFFRKYQFSISTSLDGPEEVHNKNRIYSKGLGSYKKTCESIEKIKKAGMSIGAIETTTKYSLGFSSEIVKSYIDLGFDNIFIRPLTPLGKAANDWDKIGYTAEEFVDFYGQVLDKILDLNKQGNYISENHALIFLKKILGIPINYMELRSPCGAGIGQIAYYSDGNIFTCDEGRMIYEMGEDAFCLGNVYKNSYQELIENGACKTVCAASILESLPGCCDCVYQPYCGTCPVVNYSQCGDLIVKEPHGYRCNIYSGILDCIFSKLLENDETVVGIFNSWVD